MTAPPAPPLARARREVRRLVRRSGTSFAWSMRVLPRPRREAMHALYAFCRVVDDIADEDGAAAEKLRRLEDWRAELDRLYAGQPRRSVSVALAPAVERFALPREELDLILEGMEMDAAERMLAPSCALLRRYCRCVAGAVGLLSIRVFDADGPEGREFALALGDAMQLTNILRDVDEDAARGRVYLPAELLAGELIEGRDAASVIADPRLAAACETLAESARARYAAAEQALAGCDAAALRPAVMMMAVYRHVLDRLTRRGWETPRCPVVLSRPRKVAIAARHALPGLPWARRTS